MIKGAFKEVFKEGFIRTNFCTRIGIGFAVVEFAHSHSTAKKLSKEHSKELSKELSKEENFTPESGPCPSLSEAVRPR